LLELFSARLSEHFPRFRHLDQLLLMCRIFHLTGHFSALLSVGFDSDIFFIVPRAEEQTAIAMLSAVIET
jgi:hypothetical protein